MKIHSLFLLSGLALIFFSCKRRPNPTQDNCNPTPTNEIIVENAQLDVTIPAKIPKMYLTTVGNVEITSKETYVNGTINIDGNEVYNNLATATMKIKGRGNSTWFESNGDLKPKRPYKIKLDSKASIFGLASAKEWVLLANWQDYTYMTNAIAMKIGQQLGMPYTNTIIPVDVYLNGAYLGSYSLTQQLEIKAGRVDIGDDGVMLEIDSYFDEDWKFMSPGYNLPVMVKEPEITSEVQFNAIKQEFIDFESLIKSNNFPKNNYGDYFDKQQLVNYLIVYNLTGNNELKHPKSVKLFKSKTGKYTMGPIWDFDYSFGMDETKLYFKLDPYEPFLKTTDRSTGTVFFNRLLQDPEIKALYKTTWDNYKANKLSELLNYIEQYAASIRQSQQDDLNRWKSNRWHYDTDWEPYIADFPKIKKDLKIYLRKRANYMTGYVNCLQ